MEIRSKEFPLRAEVVSASAADLEVINRAFALTPLAAEQVYVRKIALCNDRYDRTGERFPLAYLERFRDTLVGKALLVSHDRKGLPLGRFFKAEVAQDPVDGTQWLITHVYLVKTPGNEELRAQIDGGILAHVSVGFRWADLLCDLCGRSYFRGDCPHLIGQLYDGHECTATYGGDPRRVEAVEASLVFLGAQYGSVIVKRSGTCHRGTESTETDGRGEEMDENVRSEGEAAGTRIPVSAGEGESEGPRLEEGLRGLAEDGRLYRADLRAEVLRLARLVGAEREATFLCEALADQPAARWKELCEEYQARFDRLFPPAGVGEIPGERDAAGARPAGGGSVPREFGVV